VTSPTSVARLRAAFRSRSSIVPNSGPRRRRASVRRRTLMPDPTSVTTPSTRRAWRPHHVLTRPACAQDPAAAHARTPAHAPRSGRTCHPRPPRPRSSPTANLSGHRHPTLPEPPIRGLGMHPERARPPSQPHPPGEPYVRSSTLADPPNSCEPPYTAPRSLGETGRRRVDLPREIRRTPGWLNERRR
jgi:hypothetical protein